MKGIMIQGTASDVGKSLITTALCRLFVNDGVKVAPFKSQNMSNNSYVTSSGEEIGRAQGIQAEAAKTDATVWMNPILLKPQANQSTEIVLHGKVLKTLPGNMYQENFYQKGLGVIENALDQLSQTYDLTVIEGAGSPVEMNLKQRDLANMKVAEIANVPVLLVADIDRGGVFANIIGTLELMDPSERKRVQGVIINKFRGNPEWFKEGVHWIEERTHLPVLGVIPFIDDHGIEEEDALPIQQHVRKGAPLDIAVIHLPYISNYSDIHPFTFEEDVSIRWVKQVSEFGNPDAVIIPGTKSTIHDLQHLKNINLNTVIQQYAEEGGVLFGICGGYQMLGQKIIDAKGTDTGHKGTQIDGLKIVQGYTEFHESKKTIRVKGSLHPNIPYSPLTLNGYEIHLGKTILPPEIQAFLKVTEDQFDGCYIDGGRIIGTYLHHVFHNDTWRNEWLNQLRMRKGLQPRRIVNPSEIKGQKYDKLAEVVNKHLDWKRLRELVEKWEG
ncbi:cobyric acid synthase [Pseudalkalibacillus berkeleyi]|uniref:Cobyric acid synthase n=1 Tax=Pseudalkalibacillus berkeleyi TaxID=1069813 RepID=A0ABS9GXG7_9BACL|nr:cobyric acid synthase [Pseudalkalibacillus berkeleyi]MCF6137472.1 cobyric acid synthase [Pseudalkalibacillus berkeleyi]